MHEPQSKDKGRSRTPESRAAAARGAEKVNIPTDLLRTFVAIHEVGSFTKAAQLFDLTQPAVSAHMRRLETLIGTDLIDKNVSGVRLTECGEEVLRHARRMLSINDQMISSGGEGHSPHSIRIGIPNVYAIRKLKALMDACHGAVGGLRVKISCDSSPLLLHNIQAGYLDLAFLLVEDGEIPNALKAWPEELGWVRSPDFAYHPGTPVPLVGSPSGLVSDRMAMEALDRADIPYEVVFSAMDMMARRAAVSACLGYLPMVRTAISGGLVAERPGVLPSLGSVRMGIVARDDLDTKELAPLLAAFEAVFAPPAT